MSVLDLFPNATFLEIGANIGMHSLVAKKRGKIVFIVEPNSETVKRVQNLNELHDYSEEYFARSGKPGSSN